MLGTTIIAAALATGDTMSHTIRTTAVSALGADRRDGRRRRRAGRRHRGALGAAGGAGCTSASGRRARPRLPRKAGLVDGVPARSSSRSPCRPPAQGSNEPSVDLFAADPAAMAGFGADPWLRRRHGLPRRPAPRRGLSQHQGRRELGSTPEIASSSRRGRRRSRVRVRDVVRFDGAGTAPTPLLLSPSSRRSGSSSARARSRRSSSPIGAGTSPAPRCPTHVVALRSAGRRARSASRSSRLKRDALEDADDAGNAFMSFFTTFGTFSIAAGILLIFLIFVMLAAERRSELGIARAVGTRRGHLVQMFMFEGVAYDLLAAARGGRCSALGVAYVMVAVMASAFAAATRDLDIEFAVTPRSLVIAYALGRAADARGRGRVGVAGEPHERSRPRSANLPEPPSGRRGAGAARWRSGSCARRRCWRSLGRAAGAATPLHAGLSRSIVVRCSCPSLRLAGVSERTRTPGGGPATVVTVDAPLEHRRAVFGDARDGLHDLDRRRADDRGRRASWVITYNADASCWRSWRRRRPNPRPRPDPADGDRLPAAPAVSAQA